MKTARYRSAWVWLAVAFVAVAATTRAEGGSVNSAAYTHPVFQFLSGQSSSYAIAQRGVPRLLKNWSSDRSSRQSSANPRNSASGLWQTMLPVMFIGLVAPLSFLALRSSLSDRRRLTAPALPFSFQRPPPARLA
jgi:hypothetical protein